MRRYGIAIVVAAVLGLPATGWGQLVGSDVTPNIQASWNSAKGAAMAQRAPGLMVAGGLADFTARHGDSVARTLSGPTITEEPPALTLAQQVRIQVLNTVFQNLNLALVALEAAIRANAGLPPRDGTGGLGNLTDLLGNITSPI